MANRVKVACRIRPNLDPQTGALINEEPCVSLDTSNEYHNKDDSKVLKFPSANLKFSIDEVFMPNSTQEEVFTSVALPLVEEAFKGYNCTLFSYGQTGSGKTHTLQGQPGELTKGITPRTAEAIFQKVARLAVVATDDEEARGTDGAASPENDNDRDTVVDVRLSVMEIYQERLRDLLSNTMSSNNRSGVNAWGQADGSMAGSSNLRIREQVNGSVWVEGLTDATINNETQFSDVLGKALKRRVTGSHKMNLTSSRSHLVCILSIRQSKPAKGLKIHSKIHLIDLAGSEMVRKTDASGQRMQEAKHINKSLSALGNVINALTENQAKVQQHQQLMKLEYGHDGALEPVKKHIPFRDSKLTRLLQDSLGGNAKTVLVLAIASSKDHLAESINTLRFGERARQLCTRPTANKDIVLDEQKLRAALLKAEAKILALTESLQMQPRSQRQQPGDVVDRSHYHNEMNRLMSEMEAMGREHNEQIKVLSETIRENEAKEAVVCKQCAVVLNSAADGVTLESLLSSKKKETPKSASSNKPNVSLSATAPGATTSATWKRGGNSNSSASQRMKKSGAGSSSDAASNSSTSSRRANNNSNNAKGRPSGNTNANAAEKTEPSGLMAAYQSHRELSTNKLGATPVEANSHRSKKQAGALAPAPAPAQAAKPAPAEDADAGIRKWEKLPVPIDSAWGDLDLSGELFPMLGDDGEKDMQSLPVTNAVLEVAEKGDEDEKQMMSPYANKNFTGTTTLAYKPPPNLTPSKSKVSVQSPVQVAEEVTTYTSNTPVEEGDDDDELLEIDEISRCAVCGLTEEETVKLLVDLQGCEAEDEQHLGTLFMCDGNCGDSFHPRCVGLCTFDAHGKLNKESLEGPDGEWYCTTCSFDELNQSRESTEDVDEHLDVLKELGEGDDRNKGGKKKKTAQLIAQLKTEYHAMRRERNRVLMQWQQEKRVGLALNSQSKLRDSTREQELASAQTQLQQQQEHIESLIADNERLTSLLNQMQVEGGGSSVSGNNAKQHNPSSEDQINTAIAAYLPQRRQHLKRPVFDVQASRNRNGQSDEPKQDEAAKPEAGSESPNDSDSASPSPDKRKAIPPSLMGATTDSEKGGDLWAPVAADSPLRKAAENGYGAVGVSRHVQESSVLGSLDTDADLLEESGDSNFAMVDNNGLAVLGDSLNAGSSKLRGRLRDLLKSVQEEASSYAEIKKQRQKRRAEREQKIRDSV